MSDEMKRLSKKLAMVNCASDAEFAPIVKFIHNNDPTLRDQFAMAALQAIGIKNMRLEAIVNYKAIAEVSYAIADAMIKERDNA